jgi:putative membrane protein
MWEADPSTLIAVPALAAIYCGVALYYRRRPTARQIAAFVLALAGIMIAITGPLDELIKDRSFATYIFQQMLLVFVVPPLLLLGLPGWMLAPVLLNRFVAPVFRVLTRPVLTFLLFSGVFALIHYPAVCDEICHINPFYGNLHAILMFVGCLLWWPLLSPMREFPRMSYPLQIMYLFLLMIPMTAVAAPITFADSVLYMFYEGGKHPFDLTPIADQVLGGLIMWVGQGVYLMFVFSGIFYRWALNEEQDEPPASRYAPPVRVLRPQSRSAS